MIEKKILKEKIWEAVSNIFQNRDLIEKIERALDETKGIEKYVYPYLNAGLCNFFNGEVIKRCGTGLLSVNDTREYDIILEMNNKLIVFELKIANNLNGLFFGYQAGIFDKGEKLAKFVTVKDFFGIKNIETRIKGKKTIRDGLLVDLYRLFEARKEANFCFGVSLGILKSSKATWNDLCCILEKVCREYPEFFENSKLKPSGIPAFNPSKILGSKLPEIPECKSIKITRSKTVILGSNPPKIPCPEPPRIPCCKPFRIPDCKPYFYYRIKQLKEEKKDNVFLLAIFVE